MLRLGVGFYRAVLRILGPEDDHFRAGCFKHRDDFFVAGLGQMIGKKAAVANYNSKRHGSLCCHFLHAPCLLQIH